MKWKFRLLTTLAALFGMSLFAGCAAIIGDEDDSQVPQSTPAPWEGTVPGMPGAR
ncbi:MAG: hypothetical protein ACLFU2_02625 [Opitutales bacterium]